MWQTDICGKWAVPSLQGNTYTIGFFERASKKIFLYFSKSKDVFNQTKDLLESEIPKCRLRHGMKDFIVHSDVGEFQSDKIRALVRSHGGEIQKGRRTLRSNSVSWNADGGPSRTWRRQ